MKGDKQTRGYTIVEVMIVLAVSGVMFGIAASFVSGKQARTAFTQGVHTLTSDIQTTIDGVTDGHYTDVPLNCSVSGNSLTFNAASTVEQGKNSACTFLGEMLHFNVAGAPGSNPLSNYELLFLAAAKNDDVSFGPLTGLNHSALTAVTSLTRQQVVPQALQVEGMKVTYTDSTTAVVTNTLYNFGIVQSFGGLNTAQPNSYVSGAQTIGLITYDAAGGDPTHISESNVRTAAKVLICLTDGTRHANITVGDNGNQLKATAELGNVAVC